MHVKHEVMILIIMLIMNNMIDLIMCRNKRIKIYIPEHIKHVHHHHVKKVPVYIVTKDKPRVMHASHIEDDFDDNVAHWKATKSKAAHHMDYNDQSIQGIYKGDESHVHEDIDDDGQLQHHVSPESMHVGIKKHKILPFIMSSPHYNKRQNYMQPKVRI